MGLAVGKINDDFVGTGIDLQGNASFTGMYLLGQRTVEGLGHGQLQIRDLDGSEVCTAGDFPDESA